MFFGRYNTLAEQVNENQKNIKTLAESMDAVLSTSEQTITEFQQFTDLVQTQLDDMDLLISGKIDEVNSGLLSLNSKLIAVDLTDLEEGDTIDDERIELLKLPNAFGVYRTLSNKFVICTISSGITGGQRLELTYISNNYSQPALSTTTFEIGNIIIFTNNKIVYKVNRSTFDNLTWDSLGVSGPSNYRYTRGHLVCYYDFGKLDWQHAIATYDNELYYLRFNPELCIIYRNGILYNYNSMTDDELIFTATTHEYINENQCDVKTNYLVVNRNIPETDLSDLYRTYTYTNHLYESVNNQSINHRISYDSSSDVYKLDISEFNNGTYYINDWNTLYKEIDIYLGSKIYFVGGSDFALAVGTMSSFVGGTENHIILDASYGRPAQSYNGLVILIYNNVVIIARSYEI